ncbi:hypothetical protein MKEN_01238800 [Mycena kentingensis (nom. inval.)]|nr:hypothetical protein MKEN_01238800 [Mycena kentingensis (nom. inval.)]
MVFSAFAVFFNIQSSYRNVRRAMLDAHKSTLRPLLLLLPFLVSASLQLLWLAHPRASAPAILHSPLLVPFLCAWGLQFAHQVGRMILAHTTQGGCAFPVFDWMWVWTGLCVVDAYLPRIIPGRPPLVQSSPMGRAVLVYGTLALSLVLYAQFVVRVINDITEYLGIACFTVRKKGKDGQWRESVPQAQPQENGGGGAGGDGVVKKKAVGDDLGLPVPM